MNDLHKPDNTIWAIESEINTQYEETTVFRAVGISDFVQKVKKDNEIMGLIFKDNNIIFILKGKQNARNI